MSGRSSPAVSDYVALLEHDVHLMRDSAGTPRHADVHGFLYDIDTERPTKVASAPGTTRPPVTLRG
jgi:carbonic anhydrase